jgi:4-hydroxybenzoate polyprenyltransferase
VASSLMATFLYTPLLKSIPFVKNVVVAFVISQACPKP